MKNFSFLMLVVLLACSQSENQEEPTPEVIAEAEIYSLEPIGEDQYKTRESAVGRAVFTQAGTVVTLKISLSGMTPSSSKAVHIHNGTLETPGRHWNQGSLYAACDKLSLNNPWGKVFYGDVGNVPINSSGEGELVLRTDLWRINSGDERDVLDKVIIVHEDPEDFAEECNPNHSHDHIHSNMKIAGGMITLISDITKNEQVQARTEQMPDFLICR